MQLMKVPLLMAMAIALALGGCGTIGAKPWERDLLARREMTFKGYPIDAYVDGHVYFSREGSSGGSGFAGGGCGCN